MYITLRRKGNVKSLEAILTIESKSSARRDIVQLLHFIQEKGSTNKEGFRQELGEDVPEFIIGGIIDHLKVIGYLHPISGMLTSKGASVVETGLVPIDERGQFRVYYIDEPLLNKYLLHYQRTANNKKNHLEKTSLDAADFENKTFISAVTNEPFKIKSFEGAAHWVYITDACGTYNLEWEINLNRSKPSTMVVSGNIESESKKKETYRTEISSDYYKLTTVERCKRILHAIIDKFKKEGMSWNSNTECLEVPMGMLLLEDYENLYTSLKVPEINFTRLGKFEPTILDKIPIGPQNAFDAKQWMILQANKILSKGYKSKQDFLKELQSLKDSPAFKTYSYIFDELRVEDILAKLRESENYHSYWNLQAPLDLYVELDERFIFRNRKFDIAPDSIYSMMDIVNWVVDNQHPEALVFYSKYVNNSKSQSRKFELFTKAFKHKGIKRIVLITNENEAIQDEITKVINIDDVFYETVPAHDRYFAYKANDMWHYFKMTAELDQCRYDNLYEATEYTRGTWRDISIYEILPEVFPPPLREQLSNTAEVNYV